MGGIKKGEECDYIRIPMNDTSPIFSLLILKHMRLLEYQGQLQKQSKDKSETSTVSIFTTDE